MSACGLGGYAVVRSTSIDKAAATEGTEVTEK